MKYYALSDKGRKTANEDSFIAKKIKNMFVFAVADGLGGHTRGKEASKIAINELKKSIKRYGENGLLSGFKEANKKIILKNKKNDTDMNTTMVASLIYENGRAVIANVGDSRAYVINDDIWKTKDHSLVQNFIDRGIISNEERFNHPQKNIVTRVIGAQEEINVDVYEKNIKDSILILCSDGVTDYVKDEEIASVVRNSTPKKACKELYKNVMKNGGRDNITIIVVNFKNKIGGEKYERI